jgi:hypothetical protein
MAMKTVIGLAAGLFLGATSLAFADDGGAITGAAGGAVAGAVVGGPVGAVVGGAAGAVIGGTATGPNRTVVVQPVAPCTNTATQTQNADGSITTTQTNCPP